MSVLKRILSFVAKIVTFALAWLISFCAIGLLLAPKDGAEMSTLCAILLIFVPPIVGALCVLPIARKGKMMCCKKCGSLISKGDIFCSNCGASIGHPKKGQKTTSNIALTASRTDSANLENSKVDTLKLANKSADNANQLATSSMPDPAPPSEYLEMRDFEAQWLEKHYDFNSIEGVKRIPANKGLRCPTTSGVTGQLYYYLRRKAYDYEKEGKAELAVACMKKSSELAILDYGNKIQKQELYPLVKILARNGQIEEAISEKGFVDRYCQEQQDELDKEIFRRVVSEAHELRTDLVIMSVLGVACAECAKYQGRVYSLSGNSRKYPKLPSFFYTTGRVHRGCGHTFSSFIDGVNDPMMEYTLSCHPLKNKIYGRDIVAFSNRPFVDDRTEAAKAQANAYIAEQAAKAAKEKQDDDNMIAYETQRGNDMRDYFWLKENIPQKCPKSVTGYRRMKTQNTKNYQALRQFAAEHGREI